MRCRPRASAGVHLHGGLRDLLSYIPHFGTRPSNVYAYAFGHGLVNALYAVYEGAGRGFEEEVFRDAEGRRVEAPQGAAGSLPGSMPPIRSSGTGGCR